MMRTKAEDETRFVLLAPQAPVAVDLLRAVVGAMQHVADVERMGALGKLHGRQYHPTAPPGLNALPEKFRDFAEENGAVSRRRTWANSAIDCP